MSRFEHRRKYEGKKEYPVIHIYTEGEKTEVNYFLEQRKFLRLSSVSVVIKGLGMNTLSVVDYAIEDIEKMEKQEKKIDEVWVVFDKDSFGVKFETAIKKAQDKGFFVVYSNECFELWYRLHFDLVVTEQSRDAIYKQIKGLFKKHFKVSYEKEDVNHFKLLMTQQAVAVKRAKKLENSSKGQPINPSTAVYKLVERLNELKK